MLTEQLFNSIMHDISKAVKEALNEEKTDNKVMEVADMLINDLKQNKKDLKAAIDFMKIVSKGRESRNYYKGVSYDKLIPELEKRLKEQ